jgi:hypothetical protein
LIEKPFTGPRLKPITRLPVAPSMTSSKRWVQAALTC